MDGIFKTLTESRLFSGLSSIVIQVVAQLLSLAVGLWLFFNIVNSNVSEQTILPEKKSGESFKDVVGLESVKKQLMYSAKQVINASSNSKLKASKGILLYGGPGCGKTLLARAMASEINANFYYKSAPELVGIIVGLGAQKLRSLFQVARANKPAIIFIDEIDAIGTRGRGLYSSSCDPQLVNQLLIEMDGYKKDNGVLLIASTNRVAELDPALLRPGRFDKLIHVTEPSATDITKMFKYYIEKRSSSSSEVMISDDEITKLSRYLRVSGMNASMVDFIVCESLYRSDRVTFDDLFEILLEQCGGLPVEDSNLQKTDINVISIHEAGHLFMSWYLEKISGVEPLYAEVKHRTNTLGLVVQMIKGSDSREPLARTYGIILVALAGMEAENVFDIKGVGGCSDLSKSIFLSDKVVNSTLIPSDSYPSEAYREKRDDLKSKIISEYSAAAKKILQANKSQIVKVARKLKEVRKMSYEEIKSFFNSSILPYVNKPNTWEDIGLNVGKVEFEL